MGCHAVSVAPACVEIKPPGWYTYRVLPTSLIPHRPPWLVLDRIEVEGDQARGVKVVSADDPLAPDGELPEVLVVEALAQTAAAVMGAAAANGAAATHRGYLTEIRGLTFVGRARVGSRLEVRAWRTRSLGRLHRFVARVAQDGAPLAEGELTFAVETGP
jgi:predicted hotdog family 3-hydroxylacyl-ACP dehydratase